MKKILLAVNNMNLNGIKTSLLDMIEALNNERYDVTLFLFEKRGPLMEKIPKNIKVIACEEFYNIKEMAYLDRKSAILTMRRKREYKKIIMYLFYSVLADKTHDMGILYKWLLKKVPNICQQYDYAVSYFGPLDILSYYILFKVAANKKVQWVHFDIEKINFNLTFAKKYYPRFDTVYVVSKKAQITLEKALPRLHTTCFILPISKEKIYRLSKEEIVHYDHSKFQIVTIGRLTLQKGPDIAINIAKKLKEKNIKFEWHFVGGGELFEKLCREIQLYNLKDTFYLENEQLNPFRFLTEADLYVQPSRHEGYGLTVQEAKAMRLPIICMDFAGADEQINSGYNGIIVHDESELFDGIFEIINDISLRESFRKRLFDENLPQVSNTKYQELYEEK